MYFLRYLYMPKIQEFIARNGLFLIKISTLAFGLAYLSFKLQSSLSNINFSLSSVSASLLISMAFILIVLSVLNWFGELQKWKGLTGLSSYLETAKQVFISHSISIFTPNKFGEYGGKCMFYAKDHSHRIIALTGVGHVCQLLATVLFGIIGIVYLPEFTFFYVESANVWMIGLVLLIIGTLCSLKLIRNHLKKIWITLKQVEQTTFIKTLLWSLFRYLAFSHQFLLLLWCFDVQLTYFEGLSLIFLMYFLSSIIPSFAISDVLIKGGIAVALFSFFGIDKNLILTVVFLMWIFNTLLPAVLGYILLWQWKPEFQFIKK